MESVSRGRKAAEYRFAAFPPDGVKWVKAGATSVLTLHLPGVSVYPPGFGAGFAGTFCAMTIEPSLGKSSVDIPAGQTRMPATQ
jgi:hypothetical protein